MIEPPCPPDRTDDDPDTADPRVTVREVPPDYNGRILTYKAQITDVIGVFYNDPPTAGKPHVDRWSWYDGATPPDQFFMWGPTTSPPSASNFLVTAAQYFTGSATNITPTVGTGGIGYQVKLGATVVGFGTFYPGAGTAQWWMYKYSTFDTITGYGYYPAPTNSQPLFFKQHTPSSGQGWVGIDI